MTKALIISSESKEIYNHLRSQGIKIDAVRQRPNDRIPSGSDLESFALAILDLDDEGWEERLSILHKFIPVITLSKSDISKAVRALKGGATEYLERPIDAIKWAEVLGPYCISGDVRQGFEDLLGNSPLMREVYNIIKRAASSDSNVLITGESGTGKELVAKAIHRLSHRREMPFVTLNCSAIPDTLLEAELFGFQKGSFTGALHSKRGIFEAANHGTLFLDEIGDVSPLFQSKVLRVLQEGEFMRIGDTRQIKVDVRLITATNRNIAELISKGQFREDLYYRLNVINIHLPPLRNRAEDIPALVRHFIDKHRPKRRDLFVKGISEEALSALTRYHFPGNVRELENIIERAIALTNSPEIVPSDLPQSVFQVRQRELKKTPRLKDALVDTEKKVILSALNEAGWNTSRAALILGVYRQFLQKKIRELQIKK
jgi:transcriptional regulator with PAS, ATPase and Fis domain